MRKTIGSNNEKTKRPGKKQRPNLYVIDQENTAEHALLPMPKKRRAPGYLKIIISVLGIYILFSFLVGGYQILQLRKQIQTLENEQRVFLENQKALKQEIDSLNDPEMVEKMARESLGMVKPGETLVIPAIPGSNIPEPQN